jgi:HEAT repeat protein
MDEERPRQPGVLSGLIGLFADKDEESPAPASQSPGDDVGTTEEEAWPARPGPSSPPVSEASPEPGVHSGLDQTQLLDEGRWSSHSSAGLDSPVSVERRRALEEMARRGAREEDLEPLVRLIGDPERAIRQTALEALAPLAPRLDSEVVRRALADPTDEVRAAAVRLAAAAGTRLVPELVPALHARTWPLAQHAALETLPDLLRRDGLTQDGEDLVLSGVAAMKLPLSPAEHGFLSKVMEALTPVRVVSALGRSDDVRMGAARLLLHDGSPEALRRIAGLDGDPVPEIRALAASARRRLAAEPADATPRRELEAARPLESFAEGRTVDSPVRETTYEVVDALAAALLDPDRRVRERAVIGLSQVDRPSLSRWGERALAGSNRDTAAAAARVIDTFALTERASDLLKRAAAVPDEEGGPFVQALAALPIDRVSLVELVRGMDPSHRPRAVRILWRVGGREVLPSLRDLMRSASSGPLRMTVLEVVGESGDPIAFEMAREALDTDASPAVRATAIQVIGRSALEQRAEALSRALRDLDPDVRSTAVQVLPIGLGSLVVPLLMEALADDDERVWEAAVRHLAALPVGELRVVWDALRRAPVRQRDALLADIQREAPERLALLATQHGSSSDPEDRALAAEIAGRARTAECDQIVLGALRDPVPTVRRVAARAVSAAPSPGAISALGRALSDPYREVRMDVVRALGMIDDDDVVPALVHALKDPEPQVRELAADSLSGWNSPAVARRLAEALTSPDLRHAVEGLLARMGEAGVEPLLDLLSAAGPDLVPVIGQLLGRIAGADAFLERLKAMEPADRLRATLALGAMGGDAALEGLTRSLLDPDEHIRMRAVALLGELRDPRAFEAVKRTFLGDPVAGVVSAAEEALRKLQQDQRPST